jgi:hypothetical protein
MSLCANQLGDHRDISRPSFSELMASPAFAEALEAFCNISGSAHHFILELFAIMSRDPAELQPKIFRKLGYPEIHRKIRLSIFR